MGVIREHGKPGYNNPIGATGLSPALNDVAPVYPFPTGLVHYWTFEEASGNFMDSVGSAHLTRSGSIGQSVGKHNFSGHFNGDAYCSNAASFPVGQTTNGFTLVFWMSRVGSSTPSGIIQSFGASNPSFLFRTNNVGKLTASIRTSVANSVILNNVGSDLCTGPWVQVIMTFNEAHDKKLHVYNSLGDNLVTAAAANETLYADGYGFIVGIFANLQAGSGWGSDLDEIGIWDRAFTADDRTYISNGGAGRFYPF